MDDRRLYCSGRLLPLFFAKNIFFDQNVFVLYLITFSFILCLKSISLFNNNNLLWIWLEIGSGTLYNYLDILLK